MSNIKEAIKNGKFILYYQTPNWYQEAKTIKSVEALIRIEYKGKVIEAVNL